jgi:choline kinase
MKALILAAGRGTRIRSIHGNHPKCLIGVDRDKSTILDHQIKSLFTAGVTNIGIVVGYEQTQIIQHIVTKYRDRRRNFQFIENPAFAVTNNIYSFWLARDWAKGESFICLNGDVVCDSRILAPAVSSLASITMIVDPDWRDETMKVVISGNRVIRMSKRITRSEFSGTYIGITVFSSYIKEAMFAKVDDLIQAGHENEFFNVAVQHLSDQGVHVGFTTTGDLPWAEIDDPEDLQFARRHVFPRLSSCSAAA